MSVFLCFLPFSSAFAVTLSPVVTEYKTDPGKEVYGDVRVYNETNTAETYFLSAVDCASDDKGNPRCGLSDTNTFSFKNAVNFTADRLSVGPKETQDVVFRIRVPETTQPGGYSGAILLSTVEPGQNSIQSFASVGSLVLLTVNGDVLTKGVISDFSFSQPDPNTFPDSFSLTFSNQGDIYVKPVGYIEIRDDKGVVIARLPLNNPANSPSLDRSHAVFPKASYTFTTNWDGYKLTRNPLVGMYTAKATLFYGDHFTTSKSTRFAVGYKRFLTTTQLLRFFASF